MTDLEFVRLVAAMRRLQKEFFRLHAQDRPPSLIQKAKIAERAVDGAVADFQQGQGTLFGEEGP